MAAEEFKVIIIGESGVGKTSFVVRFSDGKFLNVYNSTVGVDCKRVSLNLDGTPVELQIWDTAGQERFKSIINRFFRASHGVIIMYDVTKKVTFDEVPWWLKEVRQNLPGVPVMLVGNKNDKETQAEVLEELAQDYAEENRLYFFHSSARDNVNVKEVLYSLATMMLTDRHRVEIQPSEHARLLNSMESSANGTQNLRLRKEKTPKRTCCSFFESGDTKGHVV